MNKLLLALIAGAFATVAVAQTPAPAPAAPAAPMKATTKEKQADVQSTTATGGRASVDAQATAAQQAASVKASKEVAKMTTAEKKAFITEINKQMVNPENPSGSVAGTAAMQKETTAASKAVPKQNVELKTKEGQKALAKELQEKSKSGN